MKKILLVTLQGTNFGNRLQNYALQSVLINKGFEVYNPYYLPEQYSNFIKRLKNRIKYGLGIIGIKKYKQEILRSKKEKIFKEFDSKHINNMFYIDFKTVKKLDFSKYEYGIVGSDQVWHNWTRTSKELEYFYLMFMPKEKRKSYAPSFGFERFENDIEIHRKGLIEIEDLSIRENSGKIMINNLVGRNAKVVPDPTFLLTRESWEEFADKPAFKFQKKYAILYFLGEKPEKLNKLVDELRDKNIQIIDLLDYKSEFYFSTPNNFVWMIHNAEFVLTDSFHACVFSVIFFRKFVAFKRVDRYASNMFDRIETLLNKMNLECCIEDYITSIDDIFVFDQKYIDSKLSDYREIGLSYIDKLLELNR